MRRTRLGRWWYRVWADSAWFVAGLAALFVVRRNRLLVCADDSPLPASYCAVLVANFRCYGKGWAMVPDAHCASGRLHFQARKRFGAPFVAWQLVAAMLRRRTPRFLSDHGDARRVTVRAERPFFVQADGDERGSFVEVEIEVEPAAARILAPSL
jgi:diacylglycerol kinase family enzyme